MTRLILSNRAGGAISLAKPCGGKTRLYRPARGGSEQGLDQGHPLPRAGGHSLHSLPRERPALHLRVVGRESPVGSFPRSTRASGSTWSWASGRRCSTRSWSTGTWGEGPAASSPPRRWASTWCPCS